jgi:AraC-like DNA-binding protein
MIAAAITGVMDSATPTAGLTSTQKVLLIHFDKTGTDRLAQYLGNKFHLIPANAERQLTILQDQAIQLIIINATSDYRHAGMQTCSRIKSMPAFAHLAVIVLIPANDHPARLTCLESGADAWIEGPLSRDYLRAQINALLTNRRSLKSYFSRPPRLNPLSIAGAINNPSFLNRLHNIILGRLPDTGLNVEVLARLMNVSRPTLYRKIRSLSDRTPNEWVNAIRLNKAAELLSGSDARILEIAKMVGFHSRSNFGKAFQKHFGLTPMEYRKRTTD